MRQTERIADGKRRFFPAVGSVVDVFVREKKSHHDRALERGRDYEVEVGGVALRSVPASGTTVIILTGDRVVEVDDGQVATPAPGFSSFDPGPRESNPLAVPADVAKLAFPVRDGSAFPVAAIDVEPTTSPPPVQRDRTNDPKDIRELQDFLTIVAAETCEGFDGRSAEWQDEFARLTAIMRGADSIDGVYAAFAEIETFLKGQI